MDFALTDEQELMMDSVRELLRKELPPERISALDEAHEFPMDTWKKLGDLGFLGLPVPAEYGGAGASILDIVLFSEVLSYGMSGLSAAFQRSACYGGVVIGQYGTEEQKKRILPPLVSGDQMVAIALTEPDSGSDAASLSTRAESRDGGFVINGQKVYTSGATQADWLIVAVRTDPDAPAREGLSTLIVPVDAPGITIRPMSKLGNWTIPTCEVFFDDVEVGPEALLGGLNEAWTTTLTHGLDAERLVIGAHCTGSAQRCVDIAVEYAGQREQFGRKIGKFQMIRQKLADMDVQVQAGRLITYHAAWKLDAGLNARKEASSAKLLTSETWNKVAYDSMQVLGGIGYMMESELQRQYRDARLYTIGGGTSEIQRLIISHELVG
ncbi:MAG: acyl-CoA/acyl-ACP dehydrogenase [Ilumatobacteraceae bacterium]|nr:acyl-CoA/acyl-ACP dehydrogenase [Ilumatobacteraceae bacterium]